MAKYYKPIKRLYYNRETNKWIKAYFIAQGQWADGHLAYTLLDESLEPVDGEECAYIQRKNTTNIHKCYMQRI